MISALQNKMVLTKKVISSGIWVSTLLLFVSCQKVQVKETFYATGEIRTTSQYIAGPHSEFILHGAQMDWFQNGNKASMDRYDKGVQQGYAFRWYPNGKLKSVVYFVDGYPTNQTKSWDIAGELFNPSLTALAQLKPD
jgi:antitoxin component YwqK of YwqJK toxin-antitoxin module